MFSKLLNKLFGSDNHSSSNIIQYGNGKTVVTNSIVGGSIIINGNTISGANGNEFIKGNGKIASLEKEISNFSSIVAESVVSVNVVIANENKCEVTADENILEFIELKVKNDELRIGLKKNVSFTTSNPVVVNISTVSLKEVSLCGSATISVSNILQNTFRASFKGSGEINLSGETNELLLNMTGSGDIDAEELISKSLLVNAKGSGYIGANAKEEATVNLMGSGSVKVYGETLRKNKNIMGSGSVKFK